jgi:hypothetical protein
VALLPMRSDIDTVEDLQRYPATGRLARLLAPAG